MGKEGKYVVQEKADGDCLYHCISQIGNGSPNEHVNTRIVLFDYALENFMVFQHQHSTHYEFLKWLIDLKTPGVWGGNYAIQVASCYLNIDIIVYELDETREKLKKSFQATDLINTGWDAIMTKEIAMDGIPIVELAR